MVTSERAELRANCPFCTAENQGPFCSSCGKIQPVRAVDYFDVFGLPRKLVVDLTSLERTFYRSSRKLHPDLFARASKEEQAWSLEQTSLLNDAYRTLKDPVERTKYLLQLEGIELEEEGNQIGRVNPAKAPTELLEEVFELNMQLEELRMSRGAGAQDAELESQLQSSRRKFEEQLGLVDSELHTQWALWDEAWDNNSAEGKQAAKQQMTATLQRRSYLRNLVREVNETLGDV